MRNGIVLGAWWIGWIFLGLPMMLFAFLIRMFPSRIRRKQKNQLLKTNDVMEPLNGRERCGHGDGVEQLVNNNSDTLPKLKDFPKALIVLLKNKILIFNITSTIFYILGATGYTMFLSKYIEVQFNKSPSDATILTGPVTIAGNQIFVLLMFYRQAMICCTRPTTKLLDKVVCFKYPFELVFDLLLQHEKDDDSNLKFCCCFFFSSNFILIRSRYGDRFSIFRNYYQALQAGTKKIVLLECHRRHM